MAAPTIAGGRSLTASRAAHDAQGVGRASDIFARRHASRVHLERRQGGDDPWDGSTWDTYVKIVGSEEVRRVTTSHPGGNWNPAWSPDGRHIAFVRCEEGSCHVYLTSPLGGSELKVSDLPIVYPGIAWSPDSHFIAAGRSSRHGGSGTAGIYLMPAQGGEPRAITRAPAGTIHKAPAFSPDGHHMAYVSCVIDGGWGLVDVFYRRRGRVIHAGWSPPAFDH